jgi:enamine deaminase RidA (YjgF/YER057c/UK114 family)
LWQEYDIEAQTRRVIQALSEALALAGHSLKDLIKVNCYLVDVRTTL